LHNQLNPNVLYRLLGAGVLCFPSVYQSFSSRFKLSQIAPTYPRSTNLFCFLSVGQNGFAKARCKGGSSFARLWFERWLVWACKCAYDCALAILH
jgi:hypothetical protein